ncbi:armadillo-type protein [Hyaloraphidium curvatum]|nr:armadillo-type protein [Hyaloraphidium curvatum]
MSWSAFDAFGNDAEAPGASSSAPTPSGASTGDFDVFAAFDPFAASAPAKLAASKPSSSAARDLFDIFGSPELSPLEAAPTRGPETASTFHAEDSPAVLDAFADFAHAENASGNVGFASPTLEGPASAAASALGSPPVGRSSVGSSDNVNSGFAEVGFEAFAAEFPQASTAEVSFAAFDAPTFEAFGSRAEPGGSADFAAFEAPPRPQAPLTEKPKQPFGEGREAARHGGRSAPSRSAAASAGSDNAAFSFAFDDGILSLPVDARESAVFRWLHNVELALRPLAKADLKPIQTGLEATLLRILTMESPKPTLPAAHSISRIFTQLYSSGDRRTVFDTVSALERILSPPAKAPPPPVVVRVAVSFVLGMLTMGFGDSVGSLFAGTAAALVKNTKSGIDGVLRCESYYALARSLEGSGRSASEPTAKDIAKAAREAIRDRSIAVRTAACDCLDSLLKNTVHLRPAKIDDLDSLLHPLMRYTLENSNYSLRRSVAALIGTVLAFALVPPLPPVDAKKRGGEPTSTRPMMSLGETLTFYAQYLIKHPTPTVRVGIVEGYAAFFRQCGQAFVEANYAEIAIHIVELSCHPKLCTSKSATLATREWCTYLLRNVLAKMLSEAGQNQAIRILNDGWLKRWPPAAGTPGPSKAAVVTVLMEVASLLNDVGPAASNVAEVVEPLGNLLNHLSKSVNTAVCWTLRSVCLSAPQNIAKLIARIVPWLKKEVANLTPDQPDRTKRFRGYALALASLISVVPCRPLYVSFELCAKVLALAVHLLKLASQGKSFRIVGIQAEVAWILIASLMCLGPDFCKVHLQQIVTFWRSHFERYGSKLLPRSDGELQMYLQVTDAALIALRTFLEFNGKELLNAELDKKVSFWLHEAQVALDATRRIGKAAPTKAGNSGEAPEEDLAEQECHIRARLYRCCCLLYQLGSFEASAPLMASIVGTLAPEHGDALATSYVRGLSFTIAGNVATEDRGINRILLRDLDVQTIEEQAERFLGSTPENDASAVFFQKVDLAAVDPRRVECPMVPPASIDAVDAAIDAFGQLFVAVGSSVQEKILEDLLRTVKRSAKGPVDPMVNALGGVFSALKHAVARQGNVVTGRVPELLRELVFMGLFHDHSSIRALASESIGRLAQVVNSSSFTSSLTQQLVQAIVDVREPNTRAGAALGLGSIQCYGGSLSGIPQLKTGFGILQSLAMDAHPTVHTWALVGILLMVEGSGLMFGSNVQATLDLIYKVLCSDGHHLGAAGNAEGNEYIGPILGRILSATLNVIGPELADKSKAVRDMCFAQYEEMRYQSDPFIAVEALKCAQQFMLFDPTHLDTASLVPYMQALLAQDVRSQVRVLRKACVTCLYQMAKRNPERLLLQADSLEEQLFGLLDTEGEAMVRDEIKDVLRELVRFSATKAPSRWIDLCKRILSASTAAAAVAPAADAVQASSNADAGDDDSSMLDAQTGETGTSTVHAAPTIAAAIMLLPRWRTHIFAMACIRQLLHEVVASGQREHVDLLVARSRDEEHGKRSDFFIYRMADVIRIAFSAATAPVQDLRLSGLDLLQDVLESFGQVQDPDFEGHSLLEQYQAQISSALSPAMTSDSSAEVSSAACRVSAVYLASGINQDLSTLSRVLRLLQELLAKIAAEKGDGSDPQPHASAMVRLAVQGAWARLLMSTVHGDILRPVVQPHQATLAKLWFKTLREYGRLSLENDVLRSLGGFPLTIDVGSSLTYLEATRNVILPVSATPSMRF